MDTQNTSRQLRYLEEVRIPLHRAGFGTLPVEGEQLPTTYKLKLNHGIWNPAGGGRAVACPLERCTPLSNHRQGQRVLSSRGRGYAPGRGCPVSRRGHRREDAGVYDRYGIRSAAQSQRAGWRLPHPR